MTFSHKNKKDLHDFIEAELRKVKGICYPVKAGLLRRLFIRKVAIRKLHPNPDDEFSMPAYGPNDEIVGNYQRDYRQFSMDPRAYRYTEHPILEPIQVQRISTGGYMILNGHHRWAAAYLVGRQRMRIQILDLPQEKDIRKALQASTHDKRVTLDLDEIVFCSYADEGFEKPPALRMGRYGKEQIRLGIPALFQFLVRHGYDVWVYTADYSSVDVIRFLFKLYHCPVTGIITGMARNVSRDADMKQMLEDLFEEKYVSTLHIDNETVLQTFSHSKKFREIPVIPCGSHWTAAVMDVIQHICKEESKA